MVCAGTYGCFCLCFSRLSCVGAAQRPVLNFLYSNLLRRVSHNFTEHKSNRLIEFFDACHADWTFVLQLELLLLLLLLLFPNFLHCYL